jgi:Uma2 family endonuclease
MALAEPAGMTAAEYLDWEERQTERWEFIGGEVYAMTGARRVHNIVVLNLGSALRQALRGTPCMPYVADMRVQVAASDVFFYPDVVVSCDARDAQADRTLEHPRMIAEVLSDTTGGYDRGAKFGHYRLLPSLQEFVLIDPDARSVELYRRGEAQTWVLTDLTQAAEITLCGVAMPVAALFDGLPDKAESPGPAPVPGAAAGQDSL